jgi:hypothetical protein
MQAFTCTMQARPRKRDAVRCEWLLLLPAQPRSLAHVGFAVIYLLFNAGFGSTPSGAQLRDLVDDAEWLATLLHQAHAEAAGDGPAAIVACHA